jgi:hypothetical protein
MRKSRRPELLDQLVGWAGPEVLTVLEGRDGWPSLLEVRTPSGPIAVAAHVAQIGFTNRGRDHRERRFQNPSNRKPLQAPEGYIPILIGLWEFNGNKVIAAMDAMRRVGTPTRQSLFVALEALETAAKQGWAEYQNRSKEQIAAFHPKKLSHFVERTSRMLKEQTTEVPVQVNIRPGVSMLAVLQHLNYKPWFAFAEFVDNSIQSFLDNRGALESSDGPDFKLKVVIKIGHAKQQRISIEDNAAGISLEDFPRAFRAAELPPDRAGLSEFGMGMKSAACWLSRRWSVRTSALGDSAARAVSFDIEQIVKDSLEKLDVQQAYTTPSSHFTEILLEDLHKPLKTKTIAKIKEHLAHIYRVFTRDGVLELTFDGQVLTYTPPQILNAPYHRTPEAEPVSWKKDISFELKNGVRVTGFAALRAKGATRGAGFALFRRGRLIQGSADEGYRPSQVFGSPNRFAHQRLFGELHLDGIEVTHTKDSFQWADTEDEFLERLAAQLDAQPLPLLDQAQNYRMRLRIDDVSEGAGAATINTAEVIRQAILPVLEELREAPPTGPTVQPLDVRRHVAQRTVDVEFRDQHWRITLELTSDPDISDWLELSDELLPTGMSAGKALREVHVRLSLRHPFMERFSGYDVTQIEPLLRLASALALAEISAYDSGVKYASTIRRNLNELLDSVLSKPA